ncbi:MAG TPA: TlpA disulfide reductase family protein [Thermoanaerobaculia bacterium]|nr:TlpA disulfide reductase family protein [Thermoanaerobaculia bacterium]
MRKLALSAVLSLSAAAYGADLRPVSDPKLIARVFPSAAKVRLVNVWATWCAPCVAEMADLRAVDDAFGTELAIIGVSLDDMIPDTKPVQVKTFLDKQKVAWPNIYYTGNPDALGDHYDFDGQIPLTILYDARGKELWRTQGTIKKDDMIAHVREIVRRTK